jgi:hypothetical protein
MGPKLGSRYFGLDRVLAEIRWARDRGVRRVHFVEANLNLVPLFWPLMHALADLNADRALTFYAELRGEHLTDAVVAALDAANVRVVEVGLQTANPLALRASQRRTDLHKWAAGTRRLYQREIEVLLDVIVGLPEDDADGIQQTLDFIAAEDLGSYDVFTLQVLPGTALRQQAAQYGLQFQERPPYYVLATDRLDFAAIRGLRRTLKEQIGLDPDVVEGMPLLGEVRIQESGFSRPMFGGEVRSQKSEVRRSQPEYGETGDGEAGDGETGSRGSCKQKSFAAFASLRFNQKLRALGALCGSNTNSAPSALSAVQKQPLRFDTLANHVEVVLHVAELAAATPTLAVAIAANPSTIFDVYLSCETPPPAADLAVWRAALPFTPGYLDRVAVYSLAQPEPPFSRVSPRMLLLLPWTCTVEPEEYASVAQIIWRYELHAGDELPLRAWQAAGGAGIALSFAADVPAVERAHALQQAQEWEAETGLLVWVM